MHYLQEPTKKKVDSRQISPKLTFAKSASYKSSVAVEHESVREVNNQEQLILAIENMEDSIHDVDLRKPKKNIDSQLLDIGQEHR